MQKSLADGSYVSFARKKCMYVRLYLNMRYEE